MKSFFLKIRHVSVERLCASEKRVCREPYRSVRRVHEERKRRHLGLQQAETFKRYMYIAFAALILGGCATPPIVHPDIPTVWYPSPHFDTRRPNMVIIHHTASQNVERGLQTLTGASSKVSAHFLIGREGTIYQLVDEQKRAWHAGKASWGADTDLNSSSLGIELDNSGDEPFSEMQIQALLQLLEDIRRRYHIPAANFVGHSDIAPRRKVDPSRYFPWERLAQKGFGRWCKRDPLPDVPPFFDSAMALKSLGYNTTSLEGAIGAFKLHYFPSSDGATLSDQEQQVLYCLLMD